jgi:CheY-like chemotaxis protein
VSLVLLDMTMPVMSGEEAFRKLKQTRADVKVVLSSGYNETEVFRHFSEKGLAGFIQKPYTASELAEKVQAVLFRQPLADARGSATG